MDRVSQGATQDGGRDKRGCRRAAGLGRGRAAAPRTPCAVRARAAGAGSEPRLRRQRQMRAGPGAWRPRGTALAERAATAWGITARSPAGAVGPAQPEEAGRPRGCSGHPWGCHLPTRTAELAPRARQPEELCSPPCWRCPQQRVPSRPARSPARRAPSDAWGQGALPGRRREWHLPSSGRILQEG